MLEIKKLSKSYGKVKAVKTISLTVAKGEIFGFIGPNGAGKSTTIRSIMNFINKDSGKVIFAGKELLKDDKESYEKIGYLPSELNIYDDILVRDLLTYNASFYKKDTKKKTDELVKYLDLDTSKKVEELSFGNKKKLGIVIALMHDPELIIMDEPSNGLDPLMQEKFYDLLKKEKKLGHTIFFSSHNLLEVSKVCDEVAIIKNGEILVKEDMKKFMKSKIVTIKSSDLTRLPQSLIKNIIHEEANVLTFPYSGSYNDLLEKLSKIKIDDIKIEEPSLEDMFLSYYKED